MMLRSAALPVTLLIVGLLVGGIGYADCITVGPPPENIAIQWETSSPYAPSTSVSHSYVTCTVPSVTASLLKVLVSNLAPGDNCIIKGWLVDTGTFGGSLSSVITISAPPGCTSFTATGYSFSDNVAGKSISGDGGKFQVVAEMSLGPSAGQPCRSGTAVATDVITASCIGGGKGDNCCK